MTITLEEEAVKFIRTTGDKKVDWEALAVSRKISLSPQKRKKFNRLFDNLMDYLFQEGILTFR